MKVDIHAMQLQETDKILAMLPTQIVELIELIGFDNAMTLVNKFGGLSFEMPHSTDTKNGQRLVRELGADVAEVLIDRYRGDKLYINNCDALRVYLRNQAFVKSVLSVMEMGVSQYQAIQETAPIFGITERRAYDILKEMTATKSQMNLF